LGSSGRDGAGARRRAWVVGGRAASLPITRRLQIKHLRVPAAQVHLAGWRTNSERATNVGMNEILPDEQEWLVACLGQAKQSATLSREA
jgi:hypothetical protein